MKTCFDCQHFSVCSWRQAQFNESRDFIIFDKCVEKLHELYGVMGEACRHFLAYPAEPDFKENWFKIATKTYEEQITKLVEEGMPEENARLIGFREAVLSAVKSESFLSLAKQVPILEAKIAELERKFGLQV